MTMRIAAYRAYIQARVTIWLERHAYGIRWGRITQWLNPSYFYCRRCHTTWRFVHPHMTMYNAGSSWGALCERCWQALTPAQRVPYYRLLWLDLMRMTTYGTTALTVEELVTYRKSLSEMWEPFKQAVLLGK